MKIAQHQKIETNIEDQFQSVKIGDASKMVLLNSRSLYSDPTKAVLRELYSNIMDEHLECGHVNENGKPLPGCVNIPTYENPMLVIKDFGRGCNRSQIENYVLAIFNSTKDNDNTKIGAFGLGSITPIAITDNYSLKSIVWEDASIDNQWCSGYYEHFYNAFIMNNEETGNLDFGNVHEYTKYLGSTLTNNLHTGLTFEIPASVSYNWKKALQCLEFFPHPLGIPDNTFIQRETSFKGENWKIEKDVSTSLICTQGRVPYPVNIFDLGLSWLYSVSKMRIVLDFDIGLLSVTPSRESLLFNDNGRTKKIIIQRLEKIKSEIESKALTDIASCETYMDAYSKLITARGFGSNLKNIEWKSKHLKTPLTLRSYFEGKLSTGNIYTISNVLSNDIYYVLQSDIDNNNIKYIYGRKQKVGITRRYSSSSLIKFKDEAELNEFKTILGIKIKNLKDVEYAPPTKTSSGKRSKAYFRTIKGTIIDDADINLKNMVYIPTVSGSYDFKLYRDSIEYIEASNNTMKIFLCPKTRVREIKSLGFKDLNEWLKTQKKIKINIVKLSGLYNRIHYNTLYEMGFIDKKKYPKEGSESHIIRNSKNWKQNPMIDVEYTEYDIETIITDVLKRHKIIKDLTEENNISSYQIKYVLEVLKKNGVKL